MKDWTSEEGVWYEFEQKSPLISASPIATSNAYWSAITASFSAFHEQPWSVETFTGATDSRFIRAAGIPAYGISPFTMTPLLLHDHNEFLGKDEFLRGIRLYELLINNLASLQ